MSEYCHFGECERQSHPNATCPKHTKKMKEDLNLLFTLMVELEDFVPYQSQYGPPYDSQAHSGYMQGPRLEYLEFETAAREIFRSWRHYTSSAANRNWSPQAMKSWTEAHFHEITESYGVRNFMWDIQSLSSDADFLLGPKEPMKFAGVCACGETCYASRSSGTARCKSCDNLFHIEENVSTLLKNVRNIPMTTRELSVVLHSQDMRVSPRQIIWWSKSGRIPTHSLLPTGKHRYLFGHLYDLAVAKKNHRSPIFLAEPQEKVYSMDEFLSCSEVREFTSKKISKLFKLKEADLNCYEDTRDGDRMRAILKHETPKKEVFVTTVVHTEIGFKITKISRKSPRTRTKS
ncbi:hypothetical protein [Nocardiopsis nanhaiensis]